MYKTGDLVMYGVHGVGQITDREVRTVDRKKVEYLVLEPKGQNTSRYLVPADNPNAMAKLRPVMTRQELETLLSSDKVRRDHWIADENQRKQYYRELLGSGDRESLLQMVRTLDHHRKEQLAAGRKVHLCDENFLRDAQRLIDSEFSVVLGIQPTEVCGYVIEKLKSAAINSPVVI